MTHFNGDIMKKNKIILVVLAVLSLAYLMFNKRFGLAGRVACSNMATITQIETALQTHKDVVEKIKQVRSDGTIEVTYEKPYEQICPDKGRILIMYPAKQDKESIERIINSDTFFGVQYSWRNI